MPRKSSRRKIIGLITLFGLLWGTFFVARALLETSTNDNRLYIPQNATMVIRVDGRQLFAQGFSEIILEKKDNELVAMLIDAKKGKNATDIGINFLSDTYAFTCRMNDHTLFGILINLYDEKQFSKEIERLLNSHQSFAANNSVGLILTDVGPTGNDELLQKKKLKSIATGFLKAPSKFNLNKLTDGINATDMIQLWVADFKVPNHETTLQHVRVSINIQSDSLTIHGDASHGSVVEPHPSWITDDSDFYLQTAMVTESMNEYLTEFLNSIGLETPSITHLSLNHHYTEHSDVGNTILVPHFDATVSFNDSLELTELLDTAVEKELIEGLEKTSFMFGGKTFYFVQPSPTQIYIGRNKPKESTESRGVLFSMSGSLKPFSEIHGSGLVLKMLKMSELYISSNKLFSNIDNVDFTIVLRDQKVCDIDGEILFREGSSPIDAFLNFFLKSGLLRD